jgi:hypothetical protein
MSANIILAIAMTAMAGAPAQQQPVRLEVHAEDGANVARVIAQSPVQCTASYELAITSGNGGNRSVNRGTVTLAPGERRVLATVRTGTTVSSGFSASLKVVPCDGKAYEQTWPAPGAPAG